MELAVRDRAGRAMRARVRYALVKIKAKTLAKDLRLEAVKNRGADRLNAAQLDDDAIRPEADFLGIVESVLQVDLFRGA